jgi:hypothetical protein
MTEDSGRPELCYLDAADVRGAFPAWNNVELRNDEDGAIGRLDGIVIDPAARHVQYFVVSAGGAFRRHQYLVPFHPTRLDVERQALCVDMHKTELKRCEKFDPDSFHRYSEDDLLASLFPASEEDEPQLN